MANGKPEPDIFLLSATRMGVDPARCTVVEDSLAGVRAARAAGMYTIGFTGGRHCAPDHGDIIDTLPGPGHGETGS